LRILILRPEPGASETAARARAMGLQPVVAPLFAIKAVEWKAPNPSLYDAVLLTSANAARQGGTGLAALTGLPCYAVGEATADAAHAAGFRAPLAGPGDGAAAVEQMAAAGVKRALHLCGLDHMALEHAQVSIERQIVYAAEPVAALPPEAQAEAVALIHSPRAGRLFAELVTDRSSVTIAGISANAADSAGDGWRAKAVADAPRDQALLELAARLCNITAPDESGADR
jgi:uroporphyrinogen-III synthase